MRHFNLSKSIAKYMLNPFSILGAVPKKAHSSILQILIKALILGSNMKKSKSTSKIRTRLGNVDIVSWATLSLVSRHLFSENILLVEKLILLTRCNYCWKSREAKFQTTTIKSNLFPFWRWVNSPNLADLFNPAIASQDLIWMSVLSKPIKKVSGMNVWKDTKSCHFGLKVTSLGYFGHFPVPCVALILTKFSANILDGKITHSCKAFAFFVTACGRSVGGQV